MTVGSFRPYCVYFLSCTVSNFTVASLLSCLHQLQAENLRLVEHLSSLVQRRDHLLAVNARLAIPLTGQPPAAHPHTGEWLDSNVTM